MEIDQFACNTMASRRSRSLSTPSEGEIVESGSETKATTSQTSMNDTNVNRRTRLSPSFSPRSPASGPRSPRRRSRSRTRSPYRRGEKRRRYDYDDVDGHYRHGSYRYESRSEHDRRYDSRRHRTYHDYDRDDSYNGALQYTDDYDRRDKRQRTRSRSPFHDVRKPKKYDDTDGNDSRKVTHREQSVSERGLSPMVASDVNSQAERERQLHDSSTGTSSSLLNGSKVDVGTAEAPEEPLDEAVRLEARRKRREAIKAKYRGQDSLRIQALHQGADSELTSGTPMSATESPKSPALEVSTETPETDFSVAKDEDLANGTQPMEGIERDGPSAADYDPTQDMREERERHDKRNFGDEEVSATAYDETETTKQAVLIPEPQQSIPAKDPFDMFAEDDDDDMFAPEPEEKPDQASAKTIPKAKELDMTMLDNWDDPEGYYNVRLGELINGRYHIHQNLGKGMFSSVVRATDSKTGNYVAIKIIRRNDTMRKAGLKEIQILEQLLDADPEDKKHVIRFERSFDHKGHLCMVFENLSMNLREVLKKFGRDVGLNLRAIRAYAQQMFLGLSLLRKCNILHADLKPDNLLVNEQRSILKICDLGSASSASENEITPYLVSRFYRAPEIILGIPYDYAIDIWSIGCTLYELYTGKILFTGRNNNQMLRSIMECRGKFPPKFLRKGTLTHDHFDDMLNFHSTEVDKLTGRVVTKILDFKKPTRDLKSRLMGNGNKATWKGMAESELKELTQFVDLLDRCLSVNPEKRCTPLEALKHPFISRK